MPVHRIPNLLFSSMPPTPQDVLNERLLTAAEANDGPAVQALVRQGAQADAPHYGYATWGTGATPLLYAFRAIDTMAAFARSSEVSHESRLATLRAAGIEQHHAVVGTVDLLLAAGANPNRADAQGLRPIDRAAQVGYWDVVERLLDAGADPRVAEGTVRTIPRPLLLAVMAGRTALVRRLVGAGCTLDMGTGSTLLHHTMLRKPEDLVRYDALAMVRTLVELGVDPNATTEALNRRGMRRLTALMLASQVPDVPLAQALMRTLVEVGAQVDAPSVLIVVDASEQGDDVTDWEEPAWTLLFDAVGRCAPEITSTLIALGASLEQRLHGTNPFWLTRSMAGVLRATLNHTMEKNLDRPGMNVVELAMLNRDVDSAHRAMSVLLERKVLEKSLQDQELHRPTSCEHDAVAGEEGEETVNSGSRPRARL